MIHRKKYLFIILILSIISLAFYKGNVTYSLTDGGGSDFTHILKGMKDINIQPDKMNINYGGVVGKNQSESNIVEIKEKVEAAFSITLKKSMKSEMEFSGQSSVVQQLSEKELKIVLMGVKLPWSKKQEPRYTTYLVLSLSGSYVNEDDFSQFYSFVKRGLQAASIEEDVFIVLQGEKEQKLSSKKQNELIKQLFQKMDGTIVEGLSEKNLVSLTGYSSKINNTIQSNNTAVNLQIATRTIEDKTIVTVGTPVITIEY
jgi:hypothetical protein